MIGWTNEGDGAVTLKRLLAGSAVGIVLAALAACGPDFSPNTYSSTAVQQANKVEPGVVVGVRRIDIATAGTTGAVAGAAAGGIAGAAVPESGVGSALTALGGGLVGGFLGNTVDRKINDTFGYEYIVRKSNGDMLSVTQKDEAPLAIGTHVLLIAGNQARIVIDYTVPIEVEKATDKTAAKADPKPEPASGKPAVAVPAPPAEPPAASAGSAAKVEPTAAMPAVEIEPLSPAATVPDPASGADKAAAAPAPPAQAAAPAPAAPTKSDAAPSEAAAPVGLPASDPALR
jgi:outer membrane lipoprotein SlyB